MKIKELLFDRRLAWCIVERAKALREGSDGLLELVDTRLGLGHGAVQDFGGVAARQCGDEVTLLPLLLLELTAPKIESARLDFSKTLEFCLDPSMNPIREPVGAQCVADSPNEKTFGEIPTNLDPVVAGMIPSPQAAEVSAVASRHEAHGAATEGTHHSARQQRLREFRGVAGVALLETRAPLFSENVATSLEFFLNLVEAGLGDHLALLEDLDVPLVARARLRLRLAGATVPDHAAGPPSPLTRELGVLEEVADGLGCPSTIRSTGALDPVIIEIPSDPVERMALEEALDHPQVDRDGPGVGFGDVAGGAYFSRTGCAGRGGGDGSEAVWEVAAVVSLLSGEELTALGVIGDFPGRGLADDPEDSSLHPVSFIAAIDVVHEADDANTHASEVLEHAGTPQVIPAEAADLLDHDNIDEPGLGVLNEPVQVGALEAPAGGGSVCVVEAGRDLESVCTGKVLAGEFLLA